ncbi:hypothetical protein ASG31_15965 [Chryseobacterium sp. Leaf404]|uniref:acyltransferase family protein n=1 Tax=unclassified Chryseobacterium TaxID=2593645 RepID=UPI0006F98FE3|nr:MULTISPECIES: acyltransferase [unclassified Chryseobacterium]KQT15096.1 hypothetical protein ASG31_15965 [Chryseobacterium sp. Leaf404]
MKSFFGKLRPKSLYSLFSDELSQDRIFGLDLLRFFAITTVVLGHGAYLMPVKIADFHKYFTFDGVNIFFALSGFLIGGILIKQLENNQADFSLLLHFWMRRWFRTLPTYFLILVILTVFYCITDPEFTFHQVKKYYFFCQNLYYPPPAFFRESWSLSVEEWFYFAVPPVIFTLIILFKFKTRNAVLATAVFVIILIAFLKYRIYLDPVKSSSFDLYHNQVIIRIDSIMYGVVAAYLSFYHSRIWNYSPIGLLVLGLLIFGIQKYFAVTQYVNNADWFSFYHIVLDYNLTSVATVLLLPYLSNYRKTRYKTGNLITIISLISYSMYLTHMSLIKIMILKEIPWTDFTTNYNIILPTIYILYWILTLTLSVFLYKYYEVPTTRLREKFTRTKS